MSSEDARMDGAADASAAIDAQDARDAPQLHPAQQDRQTQARSRLAAELATLPAWGSPACASWLAHTDVALALSPGALVHLLRHATAARDATLQETFFVALLRRTERQNTLWARRALSRAPLGHAAREGVREELKQELTLALWQRLASEHDEAWELYFSRALDFAQRHVAHAFLVRNGYWLSASAPRLPVQLSTLLAQHADSELTTSESSAIAPPIVRDDFSRAELADLRELVKRLPYRERVAVVMRFWWAAGEHDIACALGVTTRTVRNLLARAISRLRRAYGGLP